MRIGTKARVAADSLLTEEEKAIKKAGFVVELPLCPGQIEESSLEALFAAGRNVYNAPPGECLRRLQLVRQDNEYAQARARLTRKRQGELDKAGRPETKDLSGEAKERDGFSEGETRSWWKIFNDCWVNGHVGAFMRRKLVTRAYEAVAKRLHGKAKRTRCAGFARFRSVEEKTNATGVRLKDGTIFFPNHDRSLGLDVGIRHGETVDEFTAAALSKNSCHVRICRRHINLKKRWFVQLIQQERRHCTGV